MSIQLAYELVRFLAQRKSVVVLILQGRLGNQLFQLSAVRSLLKDKNTLLLIYDGEIGHLGDNKRTPEYQVLQFESWFRGVSYRRVVGLLYITLKLFLKFDWVRRKVQDVGQDGIESVTLKKPFTVCKGHFENDVTHALNLEEIDLKNLFESRCLKESSKEQISSTMVHIRLTDFLPSIVPDPEYYKAAITELQKGRENLPVHCYTDDVFRATGFINSLGLPYIFVFPESEEELSPALLLQRFSRYSRLVLSRSTLAWWAGLIACRTNEEALVTTPNGFGLSGLRLPPRHGLFPS